MFPLRRRDGSGNVAQKSDFTFLQFLSRLFLHISLLSKIGEAPYSWIASILIQVKVVVLPSKPIVFFNVLVAIASLDRRKVPFSPGTQASFRSSLLSTRKVTYRLRPLFKTKYDEAGRLILQSCVYYCGTYALSADIFFKQLEKLLQEARNR